jgi:hypothetical protein
VRLSVAAAVTFVLWCSAALAAEEYYVVLSNAKARCQLVTIPPQTTAFTLLAGGKVFFEKDKAQAAMASEPECKQVNASASDRQATRTN